MARGKRPSTDGLQSRKKPAGLLYTVFLKYTEASYLLLYSFQLQTLVLGLSSKARATLNFRNPFGKSA